MTEKEKRDQLVMLLGKYAVRLGNLYDKFVTKLSALAKRIGVDVTDLLGKDTLFRFDKYPELRKELRDLQRQFFLDNMLIMKSGIQSGAALSFQQSNGTLGRFSILSDKALSTARSRAVKAFYEARMKPSKGLSLSDSVWNYVNQSVSEVEVGITDVISDGLEKGTSADTLAREIRKYLNNPDMMYRRYHEKVAENGGEKDIAFWRKRVMGDDGKVHFVKTDPEHTGTGVYRSARKNALRVARTEINGSFHYANYTRWQQEPFVIGIHIWLSPQHPVYDICDEVTGDYPKDFLFRGWHPNCICTSSPITIQGDEKKDFYRRLANGEDMSGYVSPNRVKDVPEGYKRWIREHEKEILAGARKGKLAWHLEDNKKYWSELVGDEKTKSVWGQVLKNAELPKQKYLSYDNQWEKVYFDKESYGYVVADKERISAAGKNKTEQQKLAKEIRMCKVFASVGHQIELRNDMKEETFDVFFDGMKADLKSLKSHNNIEHRASKAINRQGAEIVLFEFTQENKQIHQTLAQLGKKGYKGFYYFLGKNIVHSL